MYFLPSEPRHCKAQSQQNARGESRRGKKKSRRAQADSVLLHRSCTEVAQCCADVAENLHSSPPPASLFVSVRMSREGSCCSLVQSAYYLIYNIIDYQCYNINRVHAIQYSAHENIHETASLRMSRAGSCCSLSGAEAENNSPAAASCKICRNAKSTKLQSWQRANAAIDYLVDIPKVHIGLKITWKNKRKLKNGTALQLFTVLWSVGFSQLCKKKLQNDSKTYWNQLERHCSRLF